MATGTPRGSLERFRVTSSTINFKNLDIVKVTRSMMIKAKIPPIVIFKVPTVLSSVKKSDMEIKTDRETSKATINKTNQ